MGRVFVVDLYLWRINDEKTRVWLEALIGGFSVGLKLSFC